MMSTTGSGRMSRRIVLRHTALALGAVASAVAATRAEAQQKIAPAVVRYQPQPKGQQRCDNCVHFQPPNACQFVQGEISPSGWCSLYAAKT
jgi:hypothetical protein